MRDTLAIAWPILLDDAAMIADQAGHTATAELLRAETARVRRVLAVDCSEQLAEPLAAGE
ncbi:hypothetical protein [Paractinoplanes globisporus]|uniref:Uncharacterized protein n=1 Tax=Paractinoplanes globisporus TaxID=113565 RepID=A0ABW6WLG4_9ACTN|nr:hypothetical protein [Actinoplanes globisporus]